MKKWICFVLALTLCFALCACGESEKTQTPKDPEVVEVIDKINAVGKVTMASGDAIADAESAYAALTDQQKSAVTNYIVLTNARNTFDRISNVVNLIDQIGTVTLESEEKIITAEQAYEMLPERDRDLITNLDALRAARAAFEALPRIVQLDAETFQYYFQISNNFSVTKSDGNGYTTKVTGDILVAPFDTMKAVENVTAAIRVHYAVTRDTNGDMVPTEGTKDVTITLDSAGTGSAAFTGGSYTSQLDYPTFTLLSYEVLSATGTVDTAKG